MGGAWGFQEPSSRAGTRLQAKQGGRAQQSSVGVAAALALWKLWEMKARGKGHRPSWPWAGYNRLIGQTEGAGGVNGVAVPSHNIKMQSGEVGFHVWQWLIWSGQKRVTWEKIILNHFAANKTLFQSMKATCTRERYWYSHIPKSKPMV